MLKLLIVLWLSYKGFVSSKAENAANAWDEKDMQNFVTEFGKLLLAILAPVGGMSLLLLAAYRLREPIIALVMVPILIASYRFNHPGDTGGGDPGGKVDEELARQRAKELYPSVLSWMFRVLVAVSSFTGIDRKRDVREIETASSNGEHFYMDKLVPVYQFELDCENEVTQEQADILRDKLQHYGQKYISEYPMLISSDSAGRSAMEVLTVHPLGHRICIDVVQTTEASISMIDSRRRARAERKAAPVDVPRYSDPDYGEE